MCLPRVFAAKDLEYESHEAGGWRRAKPELFDVLVGKRVRWIADTRVPLTGINVGGGVLGARKACKVGIIVSCDASDWTVKVR